MRVQSDALLEIVTAIANIATAVVLFPILRRPSQSVGLVYVATQTLHDHRGRVLMKLDLGDRSQASCSPTKTGLVQPGSP
jgi:hypothetical protein